MTSHDKDTVRDLVDASAKFTSVLKNKGVSQATLSVAVRARPVSKKERLNGCRTITKTVDDKCMVVMDPDDPSTSGAAGDGISGRRVSTERKKKIVAGGVRKRERRYVFDGAFDGESSNEQVYNGTAGPLVKGVLRGINATVFAYGATGSGKTHTMVGSQDDPGLMVLSLRDVFRLIEDEKRGGTKEFNVECSYTEVYNELVYDLLVPVHQSKPLELREDPDRGPTVSGLTHVAVTDEKEIFALLKEGNARRKTEETGANSASSRSHAVLEIWVTKHEKNHYDVGYTTAKLTLVDLAGAERASETNNRGQQLRDGANINKSLLSLANCINALGKRKGKGFVFVPFRDSKLTRILKDGLCGNSRTVMVATVSGSDKQYEHTVNTLKYANRAKEIKTFVQQNRGTVETHIAEYQRLIDALREERAELKAEVERLKEGDVKVVTFGVAPTKQEPEKKPKEPSEASGKPSLRNPIADVSELLLQAAAALPEGDVLRVEAESLALRARRAAASGYGTQSPLNGKHGGLRDDDDDDPENSEEASEETSEETSVLNGLQYATRVLHETIRLGRVSSSSGSDRSSGGCEFGDEFNDEASSSPRSAAGSDDTFDGVLDNRESDTTRVVTTSITVPTSTPPGPGPGQNGGSANRNPLSPVPENVQRGRADAARVVRIAKQQGGTKSNRAAYNNVSEAGTDLVEAKRGNAKAADLSNRKSRVVSGLVKLEKKPTAAAQKPPPKPSPYAQSGGGGNPQRLVGGKPRSAALQRRLSKINGRG